jgi:hypothetical protein
MNYAVEMGSVTMIHIPSFIKTGSGIHKLTHREYGNRISLLPFFQNEESRLINFFNLHIST